MPKTVYQINAASLFVGYTTAYEDPMNPGEFLIPAGAIEAEPPLFNSGEQARWLGDRWLVEQRPTVAAPPPPADAPPPQEQPPLVDAPIVPDPEKPEVEVPELEPVPIAVQVNNERARRFLAGCTVTMRSGLQIRVTGDDETTRNTTILYNIAQFRIANGQGDVLTPFRDADDIVHELTPAEIVELWLLGTEYGTSLYPASWALKAMAPIPEDLTDGRFWPLPEIGEPVKSELPVE